MPRQNGHVIRTRCCGFSSSFASLSESGEPIRNSPDGIGTSFIPIELMIGLGGASGTLLVRPVFDMSCSAPIRAGLSRLLEGKPVVGRGSTPAESAAGLALLSPSRMICPDGLSETEVLVSPFLFRIVVTITPSARGRATWCQSR